MATLLPLGVVDAASPAFTGLDWAVLALFTLALFGIIICASMHKEEDSQDSTAFGSPAYSTELVAQAIYLDGADDYLALPNDICDSDDVTIGAWVN